MRELFLRGVELDGRIVDVRLRGPRVVEIGPSLRPHPAAELVHAGGGALLAGLHDHHIHLLATAAARRSVDVGPGSVRARPGFEAALRRADATLGPGRWLRAVGYHESVAGDIDRWSLDAVVPSRPVRVQQRSGARWILNSAGVAALSAQEWGGPEVERDADGVATGRLHRADPWLRRRLDDDAPELAAVGMELARAGVTGVTDATPYEDLDDLSPLAEAVASGSLPQRLVVTGGPALAAADFPVPLRARPVKMVIDDDTYPALDDLADGMLAAHRHGRRVAIHCVTRVAAALAVAAWDATGSLAGDRIEHGSVLPPDLRTQVARLGLTVVTQPGFVFERGDQYLTQVDPVDRPHLYPCRSLMEAGIPVAASTDSPYSEPDPWRAIRAAVERRTRDGAPLGPAEAVPPTRALALFQGDPFDPGGPVRGITAGVPGDLCLLGVPLGVALEEPSSEHVAMTVIGGRPVHRR